MKQLYRRGDSGPAVTDIQTRLSALGFPVGPVGPDGIYGSVTEAGVCAFQASRELQVDGVVGDQTWRALVDSGRFLGERLLYLRSPFFRGADVDEVQRILGSLGFRSPADGIFGPATDRALREFQRNVGLPADGIVGPATLRALGNLNHMVANNPQGLVPWKLVPQAPARKGPLSGCRVTLAYCADDPDPALVGGRRRLAGKIAHLLRVAGARARIQPIRRGQTDSEHEPASDLLVGIGFPLSHDTRQELTVLYPQAQPASRAQAERAASTLSRLAGSEVDVLPGRFETAAPSVYVTLNPSNEGTMLSDETLCQRIAVAVVDGVGTT